MEIINLSSYHCFELNIILKKYMGIINLSSCYEEPQLYLDFGPEI